MRETATELCAVYLRGSRLAHGTLTGLSTQEPRFIIACGAMEQEVDTLGRADEGDGDVGGLTAHAVTADEGEEGEEPVAREVHELATQFVPAWP